MMKSRKQMLSEKADAERRRCLDWLLQFMENDQPKVRTKVDLRDTAMRELSVSKNSFDGAWIIAIEESGRDDWYAPLRRRPRFKS